MSFQFNSDKENIVGINPTIKGSSSITFRSGSGDDEVEVVRIISGDGTPRVGINRTGERIAKINVTNGGFGYTDTDEGRPDVYIEPPQLTGGEQATAVAIVNQGIVIGVTITNKGTGYTSAPVVELQNGSGINATAEAELDTIDYQLDVSGAIRTSTSIISDTATILNLDVNNFVTSDLKMRAPHLKNFSNGGGTIWSPSVLLQKGDYRYYGFNIYQCTEVGVTDSATPPLHTDGIEINGTASLKHVGYRIQDENGAFYGEFGNSGLFPRSNTPALGDRSDKIATTEYVLNLATNDVGGRLYVSEQIGNDANDGRSAAQPVRTIKRAAQLAWATPGVKETIIVSGGDYLEDNPISLPPDASVVGDNLRLVLIRPNNPGKHIFKFGDKNYVIGVTYRDKLDVNGNPESTWDFAMVFDDKQRIIYDESTNGTIGTNFPIGHQIFGTPKYRLNFSQNTGTDLLTINQRIFGVNTGSIGVISKVTFDDTLDPQTGLPLNQSGVLEYVLSSGLFISGEAFRYGGSDTISWTANADYTLDQLVWYNENVYRITVAGTGTNEPPTHGSGAQTFGTAEFTWERAAKEFSSSGVISIRSEGEVVFDNKTSEASTLPIYRLDASLQGTFSDGFQSDLFPGLSGPEDLGGIVVYTNPLLLSQNIHDFKEGEEIEISGLPSSHATAGDLSVLNGRQRIYKVIEDADGRSRRFVIPKKLPSINTLDEILFTEDETPTVTTKSNSVTLSLLNSPNKFPLATPLARRYQDACLLLRNNIDYIADEVVARINDEFKQDHFSIYDRTEFSLKIYLGPTPDEHTYVSGGNIIHDGVTYAISNLVYDNIVTGEATISSNDSLLNIPEDAVVRLEDITLRCVSEGAAIEKVYPSFSIRKSDARCRRDVGFFINAIIKDLEFGSNFNVIKDAKTYIDGTGSFIDFVDTEIIQTVRAIEYARELCIYAVRNWRTGNGLPTDPLYTAQYTSLSQYTDLTIVTTTAGNPVCADVVSALDTLAYLYVDVLTNNTNGTYLDAAYLIARNRYQISEEAYQETKIRYPTLGLNNVQERKCRRDINKVLGGLIRDLSLGGNSGIVSAAESYFTGVSLSGVPAEQVPPTQYAIGRAQIHAISAMRNWSNNTAAVTPVAATYNASSGQLSVTVLQSELDIAPTPNQDYIAFVEGGLTFECDMGFGPQPHSSPTKNDRNYGKSNLIISSVTSTFSGQACYVITTNVGDAGTGSGSAHTFVSAVTGGTYISLAPSRPDNSDIPIFEDWNILRDDNGVAASAIFTPTDATYDPATGDFEITLGANHGVTQNDNIRITPESFTFTCAMDGNKTEHVLPQLGQLAYGTSLNVDTVSSNTITVNVGASGPNQTFQPTAATYAPDTGYLVLEIGAHTLSVGEGVIIEDNSLSFTCDMDDNQVTKTYPRPGIDPYAGRSMPIIAVGSTTITVNAGVSGPNKEFPALAGTEYDASNGNLRINAGQHGLGVGRNVVLEDNSFTFTCDYNGDGNTTPKTYPRPGTNDPAGQSLAITDVEYTEHTIVDAPYDPATSTVTLEVTNHGFQTGDYVLIPDGALTYTCDLDGNTVQKSYPRAGFDYPSGRWLEITVVNSNRFSVNVGPSSYNGDHTFVQANAQLRRQNGYFTINVGDAGVASGSTHNFVSSTATAIKHLPQSEHTFVSATATAVQHLPQSVHQFVRTLSNSITVYPPGGGPLCAGVESSINTEFGLFNNILDGTSPAGSIEKTTGTLYDTTNIIIFSDNYITDQLGNVMSVRAAYDDYPIIEASPYTQNASVISFLGGGGAEVDGNKVKQPNCPFPGILPGGKASFPNQGKSMVASAFTIVSFGGTGYKVVNDGYTQLVSVFVIFCQDGVLAESGGYCSITNSATNFGTFALRGVGFREEPYSFDIGTIDIPGISTAGRTTFEISGLSRRPLEHYIVKLGPGPGAPSGYRNANENIEYFIESVQGGVAGAPAIITIESGEGGSASFINIDTGNTVAGVNIPAGTQINLHRPSIVNSSSHTWEFAGAGNNYNALPENGGTKIEAYEQVSQEYGRVYVSGTDELGDFKVGTFAKIENRTGAITFTGTVSISEVEFLKLKGGDVVVTGFTADNTLGGNLSSNSLLPTQKAVKDYITNNLGPYINKPFSTNPVPRNLVELGDNGLINSDQLPAIRPFNVYTVDTEAERLAIEGTLAGDIAIQENSVAGGGTGSVQSFILNNDNYSLFLGFAAGGSPTLNVNDIYTGSNTGGKIQATEYRKGVVYQVVITEGGSGYNFPPQVTFTGGQGQGWVEARAEAVIAGQDGSVVAINIYADAGYFGGKGYSSAPFVSITGPDVASGVQATADAFIEDRLYGLIINNVKMTDADFFDDSSPSAQTLDVQRVVNTSGQLANNWVSLSSNQIAASDITSGVISPARLAFNESSANSDTFLRGDSSFAPVVQSMKGPETRYFEITVGTTADGEDELIFPYNEQILVGHTISGPGIDTDTVITQVIVDEDADPIVHKVTVDKPVIADVLPGTIISFQRAASPVLLSSDDSIGNFIDSVVIANGGTNIAINGNPTGIVFNVPLDSPSEQPGSGLKANIRIENNTVVEVIVVDGGSGYTGDFTVANFPDGDPGLDSGGSLLSLQAKLSTTSKLYNAITFDVARVTTNSGDAFSTTGVARFNKSQFLVNQAGDGSIELNQGAGSNLNADKLDGFDADHFFSADTLTTGTISNSIMLAADYSFSTSGTSGSTNRVFWGANTNSDLTNPTLETSVVPGLTLAPKNNANEYPSNGTAIVDGVEVQLYDTPDPTNRTPYLAVNLRAASDQGGIRQLAFTDGPGDDSGGGFWFRGTGSNKGENTFQSWKKVWNSGNHGAGSGLDADRVEGREGVWYQNSYNQESGTLNDSRVPTFQSGKTFNDEIAMFKYVSETEKYIDFYVSDFSASNRTIVNAANPFSGSNILTVEDAQGQNLGLVQFINKTLYPIVASSIPDTTLHYCIITCKLDTSADPTTWEGLDGLSLVKIVEGVTIKLPFTDFGMSQFSQSGQPMKPAGTTTLARIVNESGTPFFYIGDTDKNPAVRFISSGTNTWSSQIVASGGTNAEKSGSLEVQVVDTNSFKVNGNIVLNEGNTSATAANTASTYDPAWDPADAGTHNEANVTNRSIVMRDGDGNFAAGTITASLDGTASGNFPIGGGDLNGPLNIKSPHGLTIEGGSAGVTGTLTVSAADATSAANIVVSDTVNNSIFVVNNVQNKVGINTNPDANTDGLLVVRGEEPDIITIEAADDSKRSGLSFKDDNDYSWTINRLNNRVQNTVSFTNGSNTVTLSNSINISAVKVGWVVRSTRFPNGFAEVTQVNTGSGGTPHSIVTNQNSSGSGSDANTVISNYRDKVTGFEIRGNGTTNVESSESNLGTYLTIHPGGNTDITGKLGIGRSVFGTSEKLEVAGNIRTDKVIIKDDGSNPGAKIDMMSSGSSGSGKRNFQLDAANDDIFRIRPSSGTGASSTSFGNGILTINGTTTRVGIGVDPSTATNDDNGNAITGGGYKLYVDGSLNVQGTVYQNGKPFSGSNWTLDGSDLVRPSGRVGINLSTVNDSGGVEDQALQVNGGIQMNGSLVVGSQELWIDSNAIIRTTANTIAENVSIGDNLSASSTGPVTISNGYQVDVGSNTTWFIM